MMRRITKEEAAIYFIRSHEPKEGYFLAFSGGKDSVVLYDLATKAGVKFTAYYSLMHDPPELHKFIREHYPEVKVLRPEYSFWEGIKRNFPPHRGAAWCCRILKEKPSTKVPLVHRLVGIRAEESRARKRLGQINKITKKRINYYPLYDWLEWEVWEYVEENKLPYCSLYDEGFSRLGCVICPKRGYKERMKYKERWPQYDKLFRKVAKEWWDTKGLARQRERGMTEDFNEFIEQWYRS